MLVPILFLLTLAGLLIKGAACQVHGTQPGITSRSATGQNQKDMFQRGLLALQGGRLEEALRDLSDAEIENPADAQVRNFRGIALARLGRSSEAELEYREAIRLDPGMEAAFRNLGFLEWNRHELKEADEALRRAVELSPQDTFAQYYLGRVWLDSGRYADGLDELSKSGIAPPEDTEYLSAAATGYLALGRQEEARKTVDRLAEQHLSEAERLHVAALLLGVHENERAISMLRALGGPCTPQTSSPVAFDLSLAYLLSGRYEDAAAEAKSCAVAPEAKDQTPASRVQSLTVEGIAEARLGHGEEAISAFWQAAKLEPTAEENWLNLTRELMEVSRYAEAITATEVGLRSNEKSYALRLRLGAANLSAGRHSQAEAIFRELMEAGDPLPTSAIGLAQVLMRDGRAEEAANELAATRKRLGDSFLLSYFQGLALARAGKRAEAIACFREAITLKPDSAEAHFGVGKTELANGQVKEAIADLQEASRLSPADAPTQRLLRQAHRRAGDIGDTKDQEQETEEMATPPSVDPLGDFLVPQWQEASQSRP